ncbi:transcriptional regulator [Mycolicibacterium canariasense]|uniref:Transcriptional regulator n=1 Tax=Mycolicibacterium canariasense TaxID=228230 RepID=A0A117I8V2_MYCCR|nr:TetR/AcrR family transcriptional regulator [Mycolicibacterium canariasense]MCV7212871.1 TetR/AcrR family transcriptional regulator [Mycolicibacterium canariasense]ORV19273.1 hypothetical protein AWB94_32450 [Mycolicibacterium canariasense]GAS93843.1 transcriptional regulator [Mycolicibacterium canariasense]
MADGRSAVADGRRARGAASRAVILQAATTLFCTRGYAGTGMSAIATAAGVHTGSIYHAFGSKQGLLDAVIDGVADATFGAIESVAFDPAASVRTRLETTARVLVGHPDFLRLFLLLALEKGDDDGVRATVERIRARARHVVADALAPVLETLAPDVRVVATELAGRIALILLDGVFVSYQLDSENADLDQTLSLVSAMAELALAALPDLVTAI